MLEVCVLNAYTIEGKYDHLDRTPGNGRHTMVALLSRNK